MPTTLGELLRRPEFRLRLIAGARADSSVLETPLVQAHSSDLPDPTPWLERGQLLLTDGLQFEPDVSQRTAGDYVERLHECGILALGFATDIVHARVPAQLVDACDRVGLPLVEVADRTPFMGIIRHIADVVAAEDRARLEWSMNAQRAVARAALRPDGLVAVIRELEKQLSCWVALYDAAGHQVRLETRMEPDAATLAALSDHVRAALARGTRAGVRVSDPSGGITLMTLGQRNRLRGVLAVGTATPLDPAGNDLVASVIGLASIALEQSRALDASRRQLRAGIFELLLSGAVDAAGKASGGAVGRLPAPPFRVFAAPAVGASHPLLDELELYADRRAGRVFFAERGDELVIFTRADDTDGVSQMLQDHRVPAGISTPATWPELNRALSEARRARTQGAGRGVTVRFEALAEEGMIGFLDASGARPLAERILGPLLSGRGEEGETLLRTLQTWMSHNCTWDPAARELGIHRHTLRNRITAVEQLLGVDFELFGDRAEVWAAMQLLGRPGADSAPGVPVSFGGNRG